MNLPSGYVRLYWKYHPHVGEDKSEHEIVKALNLMREMAEALEKIERGLSCQDDLRGMGANEAFDIAHEVLKKFREWS